jgi:hypothetical protein
MAANTIKAGANGFPIHRGEHLLTPGYHTELELKIPPTTEGPKRSEWAVGRVWLTDERVSVDGMERKGRWAKWMKHMAGVVLM